MKKIEVTYCGMQERIGLPPFLLVTEVESRDTIAFDTTKHKIIAGKKGADHTKFEKIFNALFLYFMVLLAGVGLGYYWCFKAIGG